MELGSGSGTPVIPVHFVWAYGGTSVHIFGSFTGWTQLQMDPIEGNPTVFQTTCNLLAGYHEYKFIVDGVWRHDENKPVVVNDNYGIINTIFVFEESYILRRIDRQVIPFSRTNVDNNEPMRRMVRDNLVNFRFRISEFLLSQTGYELLLDEDKVIALDINLPVREALRILYEEGTPTAPLWDSSKGQFVGVLSPVDFILMMRELERIGSNLTDEEFETYTISDWKEAKSQMTDQGVTSRQLVHAGPDTDLKEIALKLLQNSLATLPIIHSHSDILHLASLSEILKCVCRHFIHSLPSLPIFQIPIYLIPVGTWAPNRREPNRPPLAMLRPTASLGEALNLLLQAQVSSIPIVDENNSLLDIYARSDIVSLADDNIYSRTKLDDMTIHQVLPLDLSSQRCHMCVRFDTLFKVMEELSKPGVDGLLLWRLRAGVWKESSLFMIYLSFYSGSLIKMVF